MAAGDLKLPTLEMVRDSLIRQEDSIVFALIERARFPRNARAYDSTFFSQGGWSLVQLFVREAEALHSKAGYYQRPEDVPFFPGDLPAPLIPHTFPQVLHSASASVSVSGTIWDAYINDFLPLFTSAGDDGNYASTVASDLVCLQALSRRIHYGKYVAEVKFAGAPNDYADKIRAKDKDALMRMLTFEAVEEMVKKRVAQKAQLFGQNVVVADDENGRKQQASGDDLKCKVDPLVVSKMYGEWIIPLTKVVEVEYLLRRLD